MTVQKNVEFRPLKIEKLKFQLNFPIQNLQFPTFLIWVVEISNRHFCKLQKFGKKFHLTIFRIPSSFHDNWI